MTRYRTTIDLDKIESYFNRPQPINPEAIIVDGQLVAIKIAGLRIHANHFGTGLVVAIEEN